jgi:hypothetical protein
MKPAIIVLTIAGFLGGVPAAYAWTEMPENVAPVAQQAQADARKTWRRDAYVSSVKVAHVQNQGAAPFYELVVTIYSPSKKRGRWLSYGGPFGDQMHEWKDHYDYAVGPVPVFTIDVGQAVAIARKHGMQGPLDTATLEVRTLGNLAPVLAWVVSSENTVHGEEVVVEAFTGEILRFDRVFDSLEKRNAEIAASLARLWTALRRLFGGAGAGGGNGFSPSPFELSPSSESSGGGYNQAEANRQSGLSNAYWNGGPEAYERAQNGTMTWEDKCRFQGC